MPLGDGEEWWHGLVSPFRVTHSLTEWMRIRLASERFQSARLLQQKPHW